MMEIKIQCPCGQKYKFDVQPLHGRMQGTVKGPVCCIDGTAEAERILQHQLAASLNSPAPVAAAPGAGVRVTAVRQVQPAQVVPHRQSTAAPAVMGGTHTGADSNVRELKIGWKVWGWIILAVVLTLYNFGSRWYRKERLAKKAMEWVAGSDVATASATGHYEWSLPSDDGAMLLVRHTNAAVIGQACVDYHRDQLRRTLVLENSNSDDEDPNARYFIWPAHNGCVEIDGSIFWDETYAAALSGLA